MVISQAQPLEQNYLVLFGAEKTGVRLAKKIGKKQSHKSMI
jgi:hypothetical protein